jgi:hypothetical protein
MEIWLALVEARQWLVGEGGAQLLDCLKLGGVGVRVVLRAWALGEPSEGAAFRRRLHAHTAG